MVKQIALALAGIVLAFAVCRAAPLYEKVCKAPDVPRVMLSAGLAPYTGGLICPTEGTCWFEHSREVFGAHLVVVCLSPSEHQAALERGKE